MAIDTKPNLSDSKFEQFSGETLSLSGNTNIYGHFAIKSGATISILSNYGVGKILTSDSGGTGTWQNAISISGERITKEIIQNSHGFNINDVIGWSGGTYNKAIADGSYDGEVLGIVSKYLNANCFELTQAGYVTGLTGITINSTYFLSDITAGLLTSVEPTGNTHISKSVLIADSSTSGWVLPYAGYIITTGSTGGGTWGTITGTLSGQTDLQNILDTKLNTTIFNTYTGTTAPATYVTKAVFNAFTGTTYNLGSPAVCTVGGISGGTVLTGKTAFQLFEELLVPEIFGTLTAPSTTISISPTTTLYEIGCSISTLCVTGTFNRGCINPQGCSTSDKRSGYANCYNFTGCQVVGSYACSGSSVMKSGSSYVVCASQTWTISTCYDIGVQPKGSKGTNFNTPLATGVTSAASRTISGIYPYYWGKLTGSTRPVVTSALVTGGTKVLAVSTGTLAINFSSASNQYTWLAIPVATTSKTCWYVTALDNGKVNNAPSDKYPDECQLCVSSGQLCWTDICYKVYMSGTVGAISATLCFS